MPQATTIIEVMVSHKKKSNTLKHAVQSGSTNAKNFKYPTICYKEYLKNVKDS